MEEVKKESYLARYLTRLAATLADEISAKKSFLRALLIIAFSAAVLGGIGVAIWAVVSALHYFWTHPLF